MRIATADTTITFHDEVFGTQQYNLAHDIGDIIVRRSDGIYSYQLAVTVDDLDMGITDIVRGRDLLRSNAFANLHSQSPYQRGIQAFRTDTAFPSCRRFQ